MGHSMSTHKELPTVEQITDQWVSGQTVDQVLQAFDTSLHGLEEYEVTRRRSAYGYNDTVQKQESSIFLQFLSRFLNPLVLVLLIIAVLSYIFDNRIGAMVVSLMAILSVVLSFFQEYRAGKQVAHLIDLVKVTANVYRDNKLVTVGVREVVPGDILDLSAGDMLAADARLIFVKDLFINQSSLTGESFPVEKHAELVTGQAGAAAHLENMAFMGSSIVSGTGLAIVVRTGSHTELGKLSKDLTGQAPPTAFDRGIASFVMLMIRMMIVLTLAVFVINALAKQNIVEALLFALAVAVGLAPEMLPMEVALNLSKGGLAMSRKGVIVKRLSSIQNFGAMDILCTDKTGTLTEDTIVLMQHINAEGEEDEDVLRHAYINSYYQSGLKNILDLAVLKHRHLVVRRYKKVDEIPFDFVRRVMSVVVLMDHHRRMITKGAPEELFKRCRSYDSHGRAMPLNKDRVAALRKKYDQLSSQGFRVLALGYRDVHEADHVFSKEDEHDLVFKGFIAFLDPPKPTATTTIKELEKLGITLKILSGDNELVIEKVCSDVSLPVTGTLTGEQVEEMSDKELKTVVDATTVFARLNPSQKERVIKALQSCGHTIGYMGDGINDAPALKAADVGISVNNAVGVAKDTADIILLHKSLMILKECVTEGRRTFGNITKYIRMGSSSNFGNMFSMTGASLLLPFLPMQPVQILLNNFLYDFSQVTLPTDSVDEEELRSPRPWNVDYIKHFMVLIGPISSLFDYATYAVMWFIFRANTADPSHVALFNSGWFIESLVSQTLVIYVIRTRKIPFIQSWPSLPLLATTLGVILFGLYVVNSSFAGVLGFAHLPPAYYAILGILVITYLTLVQLAKAWFQRRFDPIA